MPADPSGAKYLTRGFERSACGRLSGHLETVAVLVDPAGGLLVFEKRRLKRFSCPRHR